jgi:surface polysaccharide O-acyltransferase-like enzyme
MVSGALLLAPSRNEESICFYKRRMQRVAIPLVFWTLFYMAIRYSRGGFTIRQAIYTVAKGDTFYHLWYLYMILGLYLLTPFLRTYVKYSTSRERLWLIVVIFVLANCYHLINSLVLRNQESIFTLFIPYIGYYLCGYELRISNSHKIELKYLAIVVILCGLCMAAGTGILIKLFNTQQCSFFYSYLGPPTVVMSIAVFLAVYHGEYPAVAVPRLGIRLVEQLAPATFGIYLLHPVVLENIRAIVGKARILDHTLLMIPTMTIVTFALCYIIVLAIGRVPILQWIVGFRRRERGCQPTDSSYHKRTD